MRSKLSIKCPYMDSCGRCTHKGRFKTHDGKLRVCNITWPHNCRLYLNSLSELTKNEK